MCLCKFNVALVVKERCHPSLPSHLASSLSKLETVPIAPVSNCVRPVLLLLLAVLVVVSVLRLARGMAVVW